jgi:response regulator RpfG family c-di-GMP phosphodiesterase
VNQPSLDYPIPSNEHQRLRALLECEILDTEAEPVFDAFVQAACTLCETPVAIISLLDERRQWFKAKVGLQADETERRVAFCSHTIMADEPMIVPDAREDDRFRNNPLVTGDPFIRFYAGIPLTLESGERLGSLCVIDFKPRELTSAQLSQLGLLARQAAAMIELRGRINQLEQAKREQDRLIRDLRTSQRSEDTAHLTIFSLARLAEARDTDTGEHLHRVRSFSRLLALQLRRNGHFMDTLTDEYVSLVYSTSPLHDIGKVSIPDCVLLKPDRLDDEEWKVMQTHATAGAATLEAALAKYPEAAFLQMARDIAATHHERFDGTGYPMGLAGDDIPLCGRIVALADVYDALTSKRIYKGAYSHTMACRMIAAEAGSHFDPRIVTCFQDCQSQFKIIRNGTAEPLPLAA